MFEQLHSVLRRQLKRAFGSLEDVPAACLPLIDLVNDAYQQADVDRAMLGRSLDLSSEELGAANGNLRQAVLDLQAAHRDMEARVIDRTQALEAARERLHQAEKMEAIGQLAGGIAHDFNNLLTVIGGCTELLAGSLLREADRAELDEIRKAAQRATALTQQLLAFSRRQILEPQTIDLNHTVLSLQRMLTRVIREDITLLVDPAPGPAWVRIDPNQIEQVLLNLVINARDALPAGGHIRLTVSLDGPPSSDLPTALTDRGSVCLRVSDDGIGMTPAVRDRVFEPFFTTKESGKGTGLGLASVYGIVRQSNGLITVETAEGSGTAFTMIFPAALPGDVVAADETAASDAVVRRETVLLVEDEEPVRRVIRAMLMRHGYHVIDTGEPSEACTIFEQQSSSIRLLVTDVVMPGMNGPTLARRLVALRPKLPVLFLSGYAAIDPTTLGLEHANLAFLAKPIQAPRLAAKVRELFAASET